MSRVRVVGGWSGSVYLRCSACRESGVAVGKARGAFTAECLSVVLASDFRCIANGLINKDKFQWLTVLKAPERCLVPAMKEPGSVLAHHYGACFFAVLICGALCRPRLSRRWKAPQPMRPLERSHRYRVQDHPLLRFGAGWRSSARAERGRCLWSIRRRLTLNFCRELPSTLHMSSSGDLS